MFTTVAEDTYMDYPYCSAAVKTVDLAIKDENMIAQVCHYVMLHTAKSIFVGNPKNKKQYGLKAGLQKFVSQGSTAITNKLTQLHTLKCFKPVNATQLSCNAKCQALTFLMFFTEKRSGHVKAPACANGSTQCTHVAKEEATASTFTSKAIFIQCTIFAHEQQDEAFCDIPGTFLQVDYPDFVLMHLDGILAELRVKVAMKLYRKYITTNAKGKPVLYVQLEKAVYGMMKSASLFYQKWVADLMSLDFTINPYDPCVANKIVDGHQLTVCWHVDDLLIGHAKPETVTRFFTWIARCYNTPEKNSLLLRAHVMNIWALTSTSLLLAW
jgi:hypothetical protein